MRHGIVICIWFGRLEVFGLGGHLLDLEDSGFFLFPDFALTTAPRPQTREC